MSTLQLSLAIIGGLVLACIVAYNAWTSHRNAPKRALPDEHAPDRAADPALRQEPGFDTTADLTPGELQALDRGTDPTAGHAVDPTEALQMPVPAFSLERRAGIVGQGVAITGVFPAVAGDRVGPAHPAGRQHEPDTGTGEQARHESRPPCVDLVARGPGVEPREPDHAEVAAAGDDHLGIG